MPQYEMRAPNGRTYRITGPAGATNAQVKAKILAQYPESGTRPTTSRTAAVISGIERGMKPVAEAFSYLNPLAYIPNPTSLNPFGSTKRDLSSLITGTPAERREQQLGTLAARAQKDRPNYFTGGKIGGEVLATAPVGVGIGTTLRLGGKLFTTVAPKVATALEKVGRATVTAGAGVRAPSKAAVAAGQNVVAGRGKRMATRAVAGTLTAVPSAILTDNDILEAAAAGSLVPVLGHMAKFGAGKTFDMLAGRLGEVEAARILRELVSSNADAITKALSNAPAKIKASTAEFLASKNLLTPDIAAATRKATGGEFSGELLDVASERAAAQKIVRDRLRGGDTEKNAMLKIAADKKALQDETAIQREQALGSADIGRMQILPAEKAAAAARATLQNELDTAARYMDDPNFDARISQYLEDARSADEVAANLRAQGLEKLDISKVVANLRAEADNAEFVSPDRFRILSEFANNLERRAAKMGGVIDAQGLYLARREMGNFVASILGTADPKALRLGTSNLVGAAQQPIDDAIEAAGGAGWKAYLNNFAKGMQDIERQTFQRKLADLPDDQFAEVMAGRNTDFVTKNLGFGRVDIDAELQGPVLATAKKLASDIDAQMAVKQTGLEKLAESQRLDFDQGVMAKVEGMIQPENVLTAGARMAGSLPKIGGGGVAAAQAAERLLEKKSAGVMEKLVPALAQPSRARSLLETRSAEDYVNRLLYGKQSAPPLVAPPRQIQPRPTEEEDFFDFALPPQNLRAEQAVANRNALTPAQQAIINQNNMAAARQQAVAQTAMRPFNQPSDYAFPDFDPESGEPLIDIDYSEGYPVPIYGKVRRNANKMRR